MPSGAAAIGRAPAAALLAAAAGALQTLAFVHTAAWALQWLCIALLAALVRNAAPRRAAWLGWLYGAAWLGAGVWWLFISMHRYGGLPAPLAAAAVALLAGALALYLALAMAGFARWRRGRVAVDLPLFAALWLLAELARAQILTGFPWLATGYAQVDGPLAAWAPWIGVYGIGALTALLGAALAAGLRPQASGWRRRAGPAALAVALVLPAAAGVPDFTRPGGTLQVTLLQTDVAQDQKFVLERMPETLGWLLQALREAPGDLVVAPETALPLLPEQLRALDPDWDAALRALFGAGSTRAALLGAPLGDERRGYTNSVLALAPGADYRYDKVHLVPFGEFIPTGFRWFTEMMNIPLGDFARGVPDAPSFEWRGARIAPNICYEDLFGEELASRFRVPARAPTIFANLSNIAWFGNTVAVPQHLNISRLRTLEFQRPMLRATNTGATAVVDHRGRVVAALAPFTRGTLTAPVQGRVGLTPYAWWISRSGLAAWWLVGAAVLAAALAARRAT